MIQPSEVYTEVHCLLSLVHNAVSSDFVDRCCLSLPYSWFAYWYVARSFLSPYELDIIGLNTFYLTTSGITNLPPLSAIPLMIVNSSRCTCDKVSAKMFSFPARHTKSIAYFCKLSNILCNCGVVFFSGFFIIASSGLWSLCYNFLSIDVMVKSLTFKYHC